MKNRRFAFSFSHFQMCLLIYRFKSQSFGFYLRSIKQKGWFQSLMNKQCPFSEMLHGSLNNAQAAINQ